MDRESKTERKSDGRGGKERKRERMKEEEGQIQRVE